MKKILFSLLILALLPAVKASATDNPKQKAVVETFLSDPVGEFTNVREKPNGAIKVRFSHANSSYPCFGLVDYNNGWWKIDYCYEAADPTPEYEALCRKAVGGYIHYSCVGIGTRNYGGQHIKLYATASKKSKVVYTIKEETIVSPVGVALGGDWVKVKTADGKHEGWIQSEWLCSNPLTNCC